MKKINAATLNTIAKLQAGNYSDERECNNLWESLFRDCESLLRDIAAKKIGLDGDARWDADDFIQQVHTFLYENINEIDTTGNKSFSGWLAAISSNLIKLHYKHETHKVNCEEVTYVSLDSDAGAGILDKYASSSDPCGNYFRKYYNDFIFSEINKLQENYKRVILLEMEGYKPRQIAKITGYKDSDVHNYIKRGHKKLEKAFTKGNVYEELADEYGLDR